jgi:hypothetical protein
MLTPNVIISSKAKHHSIGDMTLMHTLVESDAALALALALLGR